MMQVITNNELDQISCKPHPGLPPWAT